MPAGVGGSWLSIALIGLRSGVSCRCAGHRHNAGTAHPRGLVWPVSAADRSRPVPNPQTAHPTGSDQWSVRPAHVHPTCLPARPTSEPRARRHAPGAPDGLPHFSTRLPHDRSRPCGHGRDSPSRRPCVLPLGPRLKTTRVPCPSHEQHVHPCWRSPAAVRDPLTRNRVGSFRSYAPRPSGSNRSKCVGADRTVAAVLDPHHAASQCRYSASLGPLATEVAAVTRLGTVPTCAVA